MEHVKDVIKDRDVYNIIISKIGQSKVGGIDIILIIFF